MARQRATLQGFAIHQAVSLTVLGDPPLCIDGWMEQLGATGVILSLNRPVDCGAILRIRWNRVVLFGEVLCCERDRAHYRLALRLWHALFESADLAEGWKRLFEGAEREVAAT